MIDIASIKVDMNKLTEDSIKIFTHAQVQTIACKIFNLDISDYYIVVVVIGTFKKNYSTMMQYLYANRKELLMVNLYCLTCNFLSFFIF